MNERQPTFPIDDRVAPPGGYSCSVIVPCRNERDNIADCIARVPVMGSRTEIIFVDGDSTDGTPAEIERLIACHRGTTDVKLIHQVARDTDEAGATKTPADLMLKLGKGDAVRKGFAAARGDILMILDADLTVPPEDLPRFFDALAAGTGEFVNGTRLVRSMEEGSMRLPNWIGNKLFSRILTWLLGRSITDTLCGTKALFRRDYERIARARGRFGEFDPFGDFDLLFGAAALDLRIIEVPVGYRRRVAGESKVRVVRHGVLLARMCWHGFRHFKLAGRNVAHDTGGAGIGSSE